jgi:hypothetical protein
LTPIARQILLYAPKLSPVSRGVKGIQHSLERGEAEGHEEIKMTKKACKQESVAKSSQFSENFFSTYRPEELPLCHTSLSIASHGESPDTFRQG